MSARHRRTEESEATRIDATALRYMQAVLLDLDGVITDTTGQHRVAWARLLVPLLDGIGVAPYSDRDYFVHLDGRPCAAGLRSLLASRGISVPEGRDGDPPDAMTLRHLADRKDAYLAESLRHGAWAFPGSLQLLAALAASGTPAAVVTSSRNASAVLDAAGLGGWFDVVVDGSAAQELQLPGTPDPDTFMFAARLLGVPTSHVAVVGSAVAGVTAGSCGGFGLVVGVDRGAGTDALRAAGAHIVVHDLAELIEST